MRAICSGCGKEIEIPDGNMFGLPYEYLTCKCGATTKLNRLYMNRKWWEGIWMLAIVRMGNEFGSKIEQKMINFLLEQRKELQKLLEYSDFNDTWLEKIVV